MRDFDEVDWENEYYAKEKWLKECYEEVSAFDFYSDLFARQPISALNEKKSGKGTPIIQFLISEKEYPNQVDRGYHRDMFFADLDRDGRRAIRDQVALHEGLAELKYTTFEKDQFCAIPHCSFYGCRRLNNYANYLYALTLDIDYVPAFNLERTMQIFEWEGRGLTMPTYIVNSGKGIHVVYVLEEPIWIYSDHRQRKLSLLKQNLAKEIWEGYQTSVRLDHVDSQECTHSYRVVGSKTKRGWLTTAYRVGKPITKEELDWNIKITNPATNYKTVEDKSGYFRWEDLDYKSKSGLTLEECKKAFPDWYERVIEGKKSGGNTSRPPINKFPWLYESLKEKFEVTVKVGNRYHGLCVLFADAYRGGIPLETVKEWAMSNLDYFNSLKGAKEDPFTEKDINCAALYWNDKYGRWLTLKQIERWTDVTFDRAKRNKRTKKQHLKRVRADMDDGVIRDTRFGGVYGNKRGKGGRKSAEEKVRSYLKDHPNATKAEVIRETGLTKPTVYKWYNAIKQGVSDSESAM